MNKMQKAFTGVMAALFVSAGIVGTNPVKAAQDLPQVNFVGIDHSPLVVGDKETFTLTSNYEGDVQYRAFLYTEKTKEWVDISKGYSEKVSAKTPYELKYDQPFAEGKYKLSVWVKKAGETGSKSNKNGDYDNYYTANLNCVSKDDSNRVYADGELKVKQDGLKVTVEGLDGIGGIEGPYQYKLHYFNPENGEWITGNAYNEAGKAEITFPKAGTYVLDAHINTEKSTTWKNYLADKESTKGTYEAWKLKVVTVTDVDVLPTATTTIADGLTAFDSYVEVKLDTKTPADYKVTVLGTELKYVADKQIFQGIIASKDKAAIEAGVVVVSTKPVEVKAAAVKSTKVEAGLTAFDSYVEIVLDTDKPELYKVTALGTELKYVADKKIFQGIVASKDKAAIEAGIVVSGK